MREAVSELVPLMKSVLCHEIEVGDVHIAAWSQKLLETVGFKDRYTAPGSDHSDEGYPMTVFRKGRKVRDSFAEAWINTVYIFASGLMIDGKNDVGKVIASVVEEIAARPPLQPFPLGGDDFFGGCMRDPRMCEPDGNFLPYMRQVPFGGAVIGYQGTIGIHLNCGGAFTRRHTGRNSDAIFCHVCGLRVKSYGEVETFDDLRRYIEMRVIGLPPVGPGPERLPYGNGGVKLDIDLD